MARKSKSNEPEQPVQRRSSSRIAAIPPKEEPAPKSPSPEKLAPRKRKPVQDEPADSEEVETKKSVTPKKRGRPSTKSVSKAPVEDKPETSEKDETEFEVINKDSLPSPSSEEVKKAVEAQGKDGDMLVDFVQVSKTDLPSPNSEEIKEITKHVEENLQAKKSVAAAAAAAAVEEPIKEVHVNSGCNGNCGEHNGVEPVAVENDKNGNHDTTTHAESVEAPSA